MKLNKILSPFIALCLMATIAVAMSGCDDLGAYEDTDEYYNSFGEIALISGTSEDKDDYDKYSLEQSFYNEKSREDFIAENDDVYKRVEYGDYVYMAIPLKCSIDMDAMALYLQSQNDVTVYINVFVTNYIPTEWKAIADNVIPGEENGNPAEETEDKKYDDPDFETRIGEVSVQLKNGKWNSFVLDSFIVNGLEQKSIEINNGQYILLQIRNNSGVRDWDKQKKLFVDRQTGLELQRAEITMTNLLVRALEIEDKVQEENNNV